MRDARRTLVVLSFLHFINDANFLLIPTVLPLVVQEFNLNYTEIGILLGASTFITIFGQALFGYFSDLRGRKYLLSLGFIILGLGSLLSSSANNYVQLLIAQILLGLGGSFYHPLSYAWTSSIYEEGKVRALGIQSSMGDVGIFSVFIINGYMAVLISWRVPLMIFGSIAIIASISPIVLKEDHRNDGGTKINGFEFKRNFTKIISLLVAQFMLAGAYRILYGYLSLILTQKGIDLIVSNSLIAILTLSGIIGGVIMGILMNHYGEERGLVVVSIISAVVIILFNMTNNLLFIVLSLIITGFCIYGIYPGLYSLFSTRIPKKYLGLFYGILLSIGMLGGTIATVVAGMLADIFGAWIILYISAVFLVIIFIIMVIQLIKSRE